MKIDNKIVFCIVAFAAFLQPTVAHAQIMGGGSADNESGILSSKSQNSGNVTSVLAVLVKRMIDSHDNKSKLGCDVNQGSCLNDLVNSGQVTLQLRASRIERDQVMKLLGSAKCDEALYAAIDANDLDLAKDVRAGCKK